jgi:uncharacterized protein YqgC (DUF456 family)
MTRLLAVLAFLVLLGFIGILVIEVPSPDLIAVAVLVLALVAYDFVTSSGRRDP